MMRGEGPLHAELALNLVMPVIGDLEAFAMAARDRDGTGPLKPSRAMLWLACDIAAKAIRMARRHDVVLDPDGVWRAN